MTLYAETSAVLRWLLSGDQAEQIRRHLERTDMVITSRLTITEANRTLTRLVTTAILQEAQGAEARALLAASIAHWGLLDIDRQLLDRAGAGFPAEPVRTLDAIHLASALRLVEYATGLQILSTDDRIRQNARLLGVGVVP